VRGVVLLLELLLQLLYSVDETLVGVGEGVDDLLQLVDFESVNVVLVGLSVVVQNVVDLLGSLLTQWVFLVNVHNRI
jgi:hypothetical protein